MIDVLQFSQDKSEYEKNIEHFPKTFLQISKLVILQNFANFVTESNCLPLVLVKSKWILLTFLHVLLQRLCLPLLSQTTLKMKKNSPHQNRRPANSKKGQHDWTSCRDSGVLQKAVTLLPSTGIKKIPHGNLRESLHIEGYAYLLWSSAAVGARKNSAVPLRLHLRINKMVHRRQRAYKKLSKCTFTNESQ